MNTDFRKTAIRYGEARCTYATPLEVERSKRQYPYTSKVSFEIIMGEGAVTNSEKNKPVIYTRGIWGCLGLTGYSKEAKLGFLAHVTPKTDIRSALDILHQKLLEHSTGLYEIRMFQGPFTSIAPRTHDSAKEAIESIKSFELKEDRTLEGLLPGICINTENGHVHEFDEPAPHEARNNADVICVLKL